MAGTTSTPGEAGLVVGIDIGGTGTRFVAADAATLTVTGRATVPTPAEGTHPEVIADLLTAQIDHVARGRRPLAVGVGASGPIDLDGIIRNPDTLPALTGLPLLEMLKATTDGPAVVDNDAVCAALAEHALGAAQGSRRSLHITLGTGIGVCLLLDDQPFRLPDGTHPEGGHITVATPTRPCYCGRGSCWEQAASRRALQHAAADLLRQPSHDQRVLPELADRADHHDPAALAIYQRYGQAVADGLGTLLTLYGPTTVVLGGSAAQHLHHYQSAITQSLAPLRAWIPPHQIVRTRLDDYGGAIGGAVLAVAALP